MFVKFSEDIVPLSELTTNSGKIDKRDAETRAFMWAVVVGLEDLEAGCELSLSEARTRLAL